MKSRVTIDVDYDNQPIIRIEHVESEDVRDKLVKRFLESFGSESCWAEFFYDNRFYEKQNRRASLRPIHVTNLRSNLDRMKDTCEEHEKTQKLIFGEQNYEKNRNQEDTYKQEVISEMGNGEISKKI